MKRPMETLSDLIKELQRYEKMNAGFEPIKFDIQLTSAGLNLDMTWDVNKDTYSTLLQQI